MKPFPYQEKAVEDLYNYIRAGGRKPILGLPTGSGKTLVASMIAKRAAKKGKLTLYLVKRIALCQQTAEEFHKLGHRVQIIQQGRRGDPNPDVIVGSIDSVKNVRALPIDLCIVDEAHLTSQYIIDFMAAYSAIVFIGLTGTAWTKGLGAPGYWEDIIHGPTVRELIDMGRLCESEIYCPSTIDLSQLKGSGDFTQAQVKGLTAIRVGAVVEQMMDVEPHRQTMISCINVADSINTVDKLNAIGVKAVHVDYKTPIKELYGNGGIIERYRNYEIQVLSSVYKLGIGIDVPNCSRLVHAAPTRSLIRQRQFDGRGIRFYADKDHCVHLDMVGNFERHGPPDEQGPMELDRGDRTTNESPEYESKEPALCRAIIDGQMCGAEKKGDRTCPKCGFTPTPNPDIEYIDGRLVSKNKTQGASKAFKKSFARQLKQYGEDKDYKFSWAYLKYKDKFNEEPECKIWKMTNEVPGVEVLNWIKYQQIKYAKSKIKG